VYTNLFLFFFCVTPNYICSHTSFLILKTGIVSKYKADNKKIARFMQPLNTRSPMNLKKGNSFDGKQISPLPIVPSPQQPRPQEGYFDTEDTTICQTSHVAAMQAASIVCKGIDIVLDKENGRKRAFCLVRPPGHHVGRHGRTNGCCSHGFCLLNNVAIGISHARVKWYVFKN